MVSAGTPAVTGARMSSVVPATVTGDDKDRHLTGVDLAMKLHYIKAVYFFDETAAEGITIDDIKKPMFPLLQLYYPVSGRIRRTSTTKSGEEEEEEGKGNGAVPCGRPFIKCNDGGVRIVEAYCGDWTVEEWLRLPTEDHDGGGGGCGAFRDDDLLAFDQVLGPDLGFSPLVYVQFTWFRCGGLSVGLSWAHVLGDPFSASIFINTWAHLLHGHVTPDSLHGSGLIDPSPPRFLPPKTKPSILKRIDPVGDYWRAPTKTNKTHTFRLTAQQLNDVASRATSGAAEISSFDVLSAIVWKSMANLGEEARMVTICWNKYSAEGGGREREVPSNSMAVRTVQVDFAVAKCEVLELAELVAGEKVDESDLIEEAMAAEDGGEFDCVVYGANLTFVDLGEAEIYELEMKGRKPIFVDYTIQGVGEEGTVLVLPDGGGEDGEGAGRAVTVILPAKKLAALKEELRKRWGIV